MHEHDDELAGTVLITVDSLRADAFGPDDAQYAPNMAALARNGTHFENAFAHGNWTPFSFPSIFASRHVFAESDDIGLPGSPTLAETMRDASVQTAGFNAANGFLTEFWEYDRGFDAFETFMNDPRQRIYDRYLAAHPTVQGWVQLVTSPVKRLLARSGESETPLVDTSHMRGIETNATEFVESIDDDEPFFLWLHYMDTHTPYVPAPRHVAAVDGGDVGPLRMLQAHLRAGLGAQVGENTLTDLRSLYNATINQVDDSIGRVLDTLEANGLRDRTAVILAGDHGEEFQEHGHLAHYPKLYDELVHVPYVIDLPGARPQRVSHAVGVKSIAPTVCDAMDVSKPDAFEGESLLATVEDGQRPPDEPVISIAVRGKRVTQQPIPRSLDDGDMLVSARTAKWTYIYNTSSGGRELYDRLADPDEQDNVWADHSESEVVTHFQQSVDAVVSAIRDRTATPQADKAVPDDINQQLKALGYR